MLVDDVGCDGVEEGAVVRDDEQRVGPRLQVVLEPCERVEIQVVRRLERVSQSSCGDANAHFVQQQEVGLAEECSCERQSHPPSSRERPRRSVLNHVSSRVSLDPEGLT